MKTPIREVLLDLAARPDGVSYKDLHPTYSHSYARKHIAELHHEGLLVRAAADMHTIRYFTSQAGADAWVAGRMQRGAELPRRAGWSRDDPPYLPVDAKGRPLWKLTVAPPPPRVLRTNTHSVY